MRESRGEKEQVEGESDEGQRQRGWIERGEGCTGVGAEAGHHIEGPLRQTRRRGEFPEEKTAQRGQLGGLQHNAAARGNGRDDLTRTRKGQGRVVRSVMEMEHAFQMPIKKG